MNALELLETGRMTAALPAMWRAIQASSPAVGFALGLLGSWHCATMCGPIACLPSRTLIPKEHLSAGGALNGRASEHERHRATLMLIQHAGRLLSYAALGAVGGAFGAELFRSSFRYRGAIELLFGVTLLVVGANVLGKLPPVPGVRRVWRYLAAQSAHVARPGSLGHGLLFGVLWGMLPCGLSLSGVGVAALSGHWLSGAATMVAFGLGTIPALALVRALVDRVTRFRARAWVRFAIAAPVLLAGLTLTARSLKRSVMDEPACCRTHLER